MKATGMRIEDEADKTGGKKENQGQSKLILFQGGSSRRALPLYQQSDEFKLGVIAGLYSAEPVGGKFQLGVDFARGFRNGMSLRYPLIAAPPPTTGNQQQAMVNKQRRVFQGTNRSPAGHRTSKK